MLGSLNIQPKLWPKFSEVLFFPVAPLVFHSILIHSCSPSPSFWIFCCLRFSSRLQLTIIFIINSSCHHFSSKMTEKSKNVVSVKFLILSSQYFRSQNSVYDDIKQKSRQSSLWRSYVWHCFFKKYYYKYK